MLFPCLIKKSLFQIFDIQNETIAIQLHIIMYSKATFIPVQQCKQTLACSADCSQGKRSILISDGDTHRSMDVVSELWSK